MNNRPALKSLLVSVCLLVPGARGWSQGTGELLWPNVQPGQSGDSLNFRPTLLSYPANAPTANGSAVVICPGGGYVNLAWEKEGEEVAKKMNTYGISAFVVKYRRAPGFKYPIPIDDGKRAMRIIRSRAKQLKIDTNRIGIMGFSAGGHLASTITTHFDHGNKLSTDSIERMSCKPAFSILMYPVITFTLPYTHTGSRDNLLGIPAPDTLVKLLSNEKHVNASTPPTFLVHTKDDGTVKWQNSQMFYDSCLKAKVRSKFILYPTGPHGFGLADGNKSTSIPALAGWPDSLAKWLDESGFFKPAPSVVLQNIKKKGLRRNTEVSRGRLFVPGILPISQPRDFSGKISPQ